MCACVCEYGHICIALIHVIYALSLHFIQCYQAKCVSFAVQNYLKYTHPEENDVLPF